MTTVRRPAATRAPSPPCPRRSAGRAAWGAAQAVAAAVGARARKLSRPRCSSTAPPRRRRVAQTRRCTPAQAQAGPAHPHAHAVPAPTLAAAVCAWAGLARARRAQLPVIAAPPRILRAAPTSRRARPPLSPRAPRRRPARTHTRHACPFSLRACDSLISVPILCHLLRLRRALSFLLLLLDLRPPPPRRSPSRAFRGPLSTASPSTERTGPRPLPPGGVLTATC